MASPSYPHQGPGPSSFYPQPPPVPHYGSHGPGPYQYPSPYHTSHPPHQQQSRAGGVYPTSRGGHIYANQNYPHQYQQPYAMPAPQPAKPFPRPFPPSYANAATFVPSWGTRQPISSLPKQLSMPPPTIQYDLPSQLTPTERTSPPVPSSSSYAQMGSISTQSSSTNTPPPSEPSDLAPQDDSPSSPMSSPPRPKPSSTNPLGGWAIWSRRPQDPSHAPGIIISPNARPPPNIVHSALELRTPPPSPPLPMKDLPIASQEEDKCAVIPDHSKSTVSEATIILREETLKASSDDDSHAISETVVSSVPPSSAGTTDTEMDTPTLPGSPVSSNTSLSLSVTENPIKDGEKIEDVIVMQDPSSQPEPQPQPTSASPVLSPAPPKMSWASVIQLSSSPSSSASPHRHALPKSTVVGFSVPAAGTPPSLSTSLQVSQGKKKDLLSLLSAGPVSTTSPALSFSGAVATGANAAKSASTQTDLRIRPRGLVNIGNMCFANSVLQILVYCPPFHKLFVELGRVLGEAGGHGLGLGDNKEGTPLVDSTVQFLKEFITSKNELSGSKGRSGVSNGRGKGKSRDTNHDEDMTDDWDGDSFLPTYIYDAMKEKKRFDIMRGGQQEDAEEFFGFYLDSLEEELLMILNAVSTPAPTPSPSVKAPNTNSILPAKPSITNKNTPIVEETLEPEVKEEGWMEVGKRNRMVITRTIKGAESPLTRIFGGKFRSTLRAQHQKDSVIVEDWRALRLDIQRDNINTIEDALAQISHPQPVQVTHPSRPGVTLEASQQILIDSLPQILVLHMKRFCYDTNVGGVVKVGRQVRFGAELDISADIMSPTMKRAQPTRYKLFGVLYHHGLSASGGHYTLDVLHPNRYPSVDATAKPREGWVRIDDELVSDVRPEDVFGASERDDESRCAYLLFYRRIR